MVTENISCLSMLFYTQKNHVSPLGKQTNGLFGIAEKFHFLNCRHAKRLTDEQMERETKRWTNGQIGTQNG